MKGRPVYSVLYCLLGNRVASWLVAMVVMAMTIIFINLYLVYVFQYQNGVEAAGQNGMETRTASDTPPHAPTVWIYHDTVQPLCVCI